MACAFAAAIRKVHCADNVLLKTSSLCDRLFCSVRLVTPGGTRQVSRFTSRTVTMKWTVGGNKEMSNDIDVDVGSAPPRTRKTELSL